MNERNIEVILARKGMAIVTNSHKKLQAKGKKYDEIKINLNKALGILRESGLYSFLVWLEWKHAKRKDGEKENITVDNIYANCTELLKNEALGYIYAKLRQEFDVSNSVLQKIFIEKDIFSRDDIFLITDLYERMLTYAYYRSKAINQDETPTAEVGETHE